MKKVLLAIAVSFISVAGFSQYRQAGSELSIGLEGGLPIGSLKDGYNAIYGATAKYAYNFDESIAVTLQSGYNRFNGKSQTYSLVGLSGTLKIPAVNYIPVKAGARFSMGQFYAEPQLGIGFFSQSGESESHFVYAGNIGVMVTQNFDISLKYEGFSGKDFDLSTGNESNKNFGFLGLRLAYTFPLGK